MVINLFHSLPFFFFLLKNSVTSEEMSLGEDIPRKLGVLHCGARSGVAARILEIHQLPMGQIEANFLISGKGGCYSSCHTGREMDPVYPGSGSAQFTGGAL